MSSIEETIASLNPGDYVRVAVGARGRHPGFAIQGNCWVDQYQSLWVGNVVLRRDANGGFSNAVTRIEIVSRALPPEPPVGSVVLDFDGDAWQRNGVGWASPEFRHGVQSWEGLNRDLGRLRVIYTPEASS